MIKIYLAGPFFNEKERNYVEIAANILRNQGYEVIVPMEHFIENGEKLTNEEWARKVFEYDVEQIRNADCMLAIYHGHYSDSGTAWEIGFAFAYSTTCIVAHVDTSNVASIMPVTGCYYNIKFSDIGKIDLKNLLDNERPSSRGLNAWIVEQK